MTFAAELGYAVAPYLAQETPLNQAAFLAFVKLLKKVDGLTRGGQAQSAKKAPSS